MAIGLFARQVFGRHEHAVDNADDPERVHFPTWRTRLARPGRYLSVGVVCAATSNLLIISTTLAGLHYIPALVLSFAITTPLGYALHSVHTFTTRLSLRKFARFTAGLSGDFVLSLIIMAVLCSGLKISPTLATPITTILLFVWNYASAQWAIEHAPLAQPR